MRKTWLIAMLILSLLVFALSGCAGKTETPAEGDDKPFYEGKTIRVLVGATAGGGTDGVARAVAPYFAKNIPGIPEIIVENMVGGNGAVAFNYLEKQAEQDGLTLVFTTVGGPTNWLFKGEGHTYALDKMNLIGAYEATNVFYINSQAMERLGVKSANDLPKLKEPMTFALTIGASSTLTEILIDDLGLNGRIIYGYKGIAEATLAAVTGEADSSAAAPDTITMSVMPHVNDGKAMLLFQSGVMDAEGNIVRHRAFPDIPTALELYDIFGKQPSQDALDAIKAMAVIYTAGQSFWTNAGVPEDRLEALRTGFEKTVTSAEYLDMAKKRMGEVGVYTYKDSKKPYEIFFNTPQKVIDYVNSLSKK